MKIAIAVMTILAITLSFAFVVHAEEAVPTLISTGDTSVTETELQVAEQTFGDPGTTPNEFGYIFKKWGEGFNKFFTFDPAEKAKLNLKLAKLRLAEAKAMSEQNRHEYMYNLINEYNQELDEADNNAPLGQKIADMVNDADTTLPRSQLVLEMLYANAPESAKAGLERAINNSIEKRIRWEERLNAGENETEQGFNERVRARIQSQAMAQLENHKMKIAQIGEKREGMLERSLERLDELMKDAEEKGQTARITALEAIHTRVQNKIEQTGNITQERLQRMEQIQNRIREHVEDKIETALNTTCAANGTTMTLEEALEIAEAQCVNGTLKRPVLCNDYTGTWWIDFRPTEGNRGCNPACVVDVATSTAEINWRCTGLMPALDNTGPNMVCEGNDCPNALGSGNGNGNGSGSGNDDDSSSGNGNGNGNGNN